MSMNYRRISTTVALLVLLLASILSPVTAQTHQNFAQRHPTATSIAAGAGTTYLLKRSAKNKRMHGQKLNFAEKHPYLTGFGAAVVTHHVIQKSKHH